MEDSMVVDAMCTRSLEGYNTDEHIMQQPDNNDGARYLRTLHYGRLKAVLNKPTPKFCWFQSMPFCSYVQYHHAWSWSPLVFALFLIRHIGQRLCRSDSLLQTTHGSLPMGPVGATLLVHIMHFGWLSTTRFISPVPVHLGFSSLYHGRDHLTDDCQENGNQPI